MKIGILGAGQLAQMLAEAATQLNIETLCFSDKENVSAAHTSTLFIGDLNNKEDLKNFAAQVDVITLENEFIDTEVLKYLKTFKPVYPDENALQTTQDRLLEKQCFQRLGIACADFIKVDTQQELEAAAKEFNYQAILKTRTMGYDGKGQWVIKSEDWIPAFAGMTAEGKGKTESCHPNAHWIPAFAGMTEKGNEVKESCHPGEGRDPVKTPNLILERMVNFTTECSIIASRNVSGDIVYFPLTENIHKEGILRTSKAPYHNEELQQQAEHYAQKLLNHFNYVGTIAIEFFVTDKGLVANEIAPRVHNSGHWTIEGTKTSQFANHCLAICDMKLGETTAEKPCTMINIIGEHQEIDKKSNSYYHDYFKEARPGRKLAHLTIVE